jgi:hypothetical protein
MPEKLLVAVMGHKNSGKTHTWNELFGRVVHTGKSARELKFGNGEAVEVFVVSGSPQERGEYVEDLLNGTTPMIVLCSLQYHDEVWQSYRFFFDHGYHAFVQWLNPGWNDGGEPYADHLGLVPRLLAKPTVLGVRNGQVNPRARVTELRDYIAGWARPRGLIFDA